jgi:hypothetical protein
MRFVDDADGDGGADGGAEIFVSSAGDFQGFIACDGAFNDDAIMAPECP